MGNRRWLRWINEIYFAVVIVAGSVYYQKETGHIEQLSLWLALSLLPLIAAYWFVMKFFFKKYVSTYVMIFRFLEGSFFLAGLTGALMLLKNVYGVQAFSGLLYLSLFPATNALYYRLIDWLKLLFGDGLKNDER